MKKIVKKLQKSYIFLPHTLINSTMINIDVLVHPRASNNPKHQNTWFKQKF